MVSKCNLKILAIRSRLWWGQIQNTDIYAGICSDSLQNSAFTGKQRLGNKVKFKLLDFSVKRTMHIESALILKVKNPSPPNNGPSLYNEMSTFAQPFDKASQVQSFQVFTPFYFSL